MRIGMTSSRSTTRCRTWTTGKSRAGARCRSPKSGLARRTPAARPHVQVEGFLEIGRVIQDVAELPAAPLQTLLPDLLVDGPDEEILLAHGLRCDPGQAVRQLRFQLI